MKSVFNGKHPLTKSTSKSTPMSTMKVEPTTREERHQSIHQIQLGYKLFGMENQELKL